MQGKDIGRVKLAAVVLPFMNGFWELSPDRSISGFGGMSGIPYPSKVAWLKQNTDRDLWELGFWCIRVLDMEYISYMSARAEAKSKAKK